MAPQLPLPAIFAPGKVRVVSYVGGPSGSTAILILRGKPMCMVLTWDEALIERALRRRYPETVVFTNGVFDLLHVGHLDYIEQAKALGDYLIVGINGDRSTYRLKGFGRPIVSAEERARLVAALNPVDATVIFNQDTAEQLVDALRPDIYVKGADWGELRQPPECAVIESYGGRVEYLTYLPGHSTTALIERVLKNYKR
jgi:rfaE bifunctional protein nucleotidyltransferase chain/domain